MTVDQPFWVRSLAKVIALALISLATPQFVFAAEEEEEEQVIEEVVVTGSRIKRSDFFVFEPNHCYQWSVHFGIWFHAI